MAQSRFHRLDRFIAANSEHSRNDVRLLLAQKRVLVSGETATDINQRIGPFDRVELDGQVLQDRQPVYLALYKPAGVVSATKDPYDKTVIDVLREHGVSDHQLQDLHIVGRLDKHSTGLLLLTNDGEWSRALMAPDTKVSKVYDVELENPVEPEQVAGYVQAFAEGMYFEYEDQTTQPAKLEMLDRHFARVTLTEGKYHQIKRMFGRFRNPVIGLHRLSVGEYSLSGLGLQQAGQWCLLGRG